MAGQRKKDEPHLAPGPDVDLEHEVVLDSKGNRIDEDYVREAVRYAHQKIEELGIGRGRPSLTAPGTRSPQIGVRLPTEMVRALDERAAREHKSRSEVTREALERHLAS